VELVRCRPTRHGGFEEPVRDQVGEAPVGRGGVRIVADGETEMPPGGLARTLHHVLTLAEELDHGERPVGEARGVCRVARGEEALQGLAARSPWQRLTEARGQLHDALPALW